MDDPLRAGLQLATGQPSPMRLCVRTPEKPEPSYVDVAAPFAILGRGAGCDVFLDGDAASFRHAYLQVIGRRVVCVDLLSQTGIDWDGPSTADWFSPSHRIKIGRHFVQLLDDGWEEPGDVPSPLKFKPREEQRQEFGLLPKVELKLLNTTAEGTSWPINRVITLVGRDERCRITIGDDRISKVHCSLLLLPSGLWVVDLLGKGGTRVNGVDCRCGLLSHGSQLELGGYQMVVRYPDVEEALNAHVAAAAEAARTVSLELPAPVPKDHSSAQFLTRHHRILKTEYWGETVIVSPLGDIGAFSYYDIHIEASRLFDLINTQGYRNAVVDFSQVQLVGSIIIDVVTNLFRTIKGRSAMCGASVEMASALHEMKLPTIWPLFASRPEALLYIHQQTVGDT